MPIAIYKRWTESSPKYAQKAVIDIYITEVGSRDPHIEKIHYELVANSRSLAA